MRKGIIYSDISHETPMGPVVGVRVEVAKKTKLIDGVRVEVAKKNKLIDIQQARIPISET